MKKFFLISIYLFFLSACSRNDKNEKNSSLPIAQGLAGRVLVVSDSSFWKQSISGNTMDSLLSIEQKGLLNPELVFDAYSIPIDNWTFLLQKSHCVVFPLILNEHNKTNEMVRKMFSKSTLKKFETDTNFFYYQKDIVARNQTFMFLIAPNRATFHKQLMTKKYHLQQKLYQLSIQHKQRQLKRNYVLEDKILKKHQLKMIVPERYVMVKSTDHFFWIRKNAYAKNGYDINLFVKSEEYISQQQFADSNIFAWREKLGQKYFSDPEDFTEYMITETYVPPHMEVRYVNKRYTKNTRGLWRLKKGVIGGSFVSYVFYAPKTDKIYYVEGFINCPREKKMKFIYEVEALLHSIKI